jgi:TolB-like protein/Flp pilus assembly protein TadD
MSADKDNDFLADGIHEDVLTSLAKIRDLKVISRTSVLAYRDTGSRNLKKIAADLGVAVVLEGSVRRSGNRVRVTAQLIDARTDEHLWAENYDGDTSDVFALQAKLAQQIAAALKATLTPGERSLIERRPTQDQQAYEFYQRGLALELEIDANIPREKYDAIINLHEQAVARDPAFVLPHHSLVQLFGLMYWFGAIDPTPERRARAQAELATVERLAPDAPETRKSRGVFAYFCELDWNKALVEMSAAEAGLPNDANLQNRLGTTHRRLGQWTDALRRFERAVALNPYDQNAISALVETNSVMRRYQQVLELTKRYLAMFPDNAWLRQFQVNAQYALDQDRAAWRRTKAAVPLFPYDKLGLHETYRRALREGDLAAADQALTDPRLASVRSVSGAIEEPVALHRAELALLRGDAAAAKKFAAEAAATLQAGRWSPRQELLVRICAARAQICAGQVDAGVRVMRDTLEQLVQQDKFIVAATWLEAARTLAATGRTEEALDCLRRLFSGPAYASPPEVRDDPFFTKLKDDPRFEEILRSAKPL